MILDEMLIVTKENGMAFGAAGTLGMAWISYRLVKAGSQRHEINAVSQPIFLNLTDQLKCAEEGRYPQCGISDSEFQLLSQHLNCIERFFFKKALSEFKDAQHNCGEYKRGRYYFHSPMILIRAIKKLQKYAKPR